MKAKEYVNPHYDRGFKTMRLWKGKISEMHEFHDNDSQASDKEEDDPEDSLFKNSIDDGADEGTKLNHNFYDTFSNRQSLNAVI